MIKELSANDLKIIFDSKKINCNSTDELEPLEGIIGQDRAVKALKFGLNISNSGFNIFVSGYSGTGRTTSVKEFVEEVAKTKPTPPDWCYVNNFNDSYQPNVIELPPGRGKVFREDIKNFVDSVKSLLPKVFESKDYTEKRDAIVKNADTAKQELLNGLNSRAQSQGFILKTTQIGVFIVPVINGKVLNDQDFLKLDQKTKDKMQEKRTAINDDMKKTMDTVRSYDKKLAEDIKQLNHDAALYAIEKFINDIKTDYKDVAEVIEFVEEIQKDILKNVDIFIPGNLKTGQQQDIFPWLKEAPFKKYEVNLIVDNSGLSGAPVVIEQNPTYQNLFGRIEKEAQFGVLTTDFTMIRSGAIHRSNGGFLVMPVEELLKNFFSWDSLKMALVNKEITIEEASEKLGYVSTKGLRPEPLPLDVKVILIGNPIYFNLLFSLDDDFKKLFKVKADFDLSMDRNDDNIKNYARFICTICNKEKLKHLEAPAVIKVIEYSCRLAENREKVSTRFSDIADIITEANYYAYSENSKYIKTGHIKKAIEEKVFRSNLMEEKIKEHINDGTILIDTKSSAIGQINGLSVTSLGDYSFGRPSRVTASIGAGKDGIIDIERETKLGGPIHTKGVLILSGYIAQKYSADKPLNLSARIVFEQSYGGIEGDSASSAELYALLSALSGIPIKQNFAVTGSVNQKGQVQAIGGVNEKIEGFFAVCRARGLTGDQGVIIPQSNIKNLVLKDEVIEAVKENKFHIYIVSTIEEGIEILTGVKAGKMGSDGKYEEGTINYRINKKIEELAEKMKNLKGSSVKDV
ncbi:MAG: ATP-dependent protease [Actinobacteria bacterium]|nr:ATP-dependent protease [Actinomycetota bacterium]